MQLLMIISDNFVLVAMGKVIFCTNGFYSFLEIDRQFTIQKMFVQFIR
jgi:hypothetical protein